LEVVDTQTGASRRFDITPEAVRRGRVLQWLSDTELLVIARPDGRPPPDVRQGRVIAEDLPPRLEAAASGAGAQTVLGSGAYAAVRRRAPPDRLVRVDVLTGASVVVAEGAFVDFEVSPDHRRVALFESGADLQPSADGPVRGPAGLETEQTKLALLDLATGRPRAACPDCDLLPNLLSWSPDGDRLLVFARGPDGLWTSGRLCVIDAVDGEATPVGADLSLQARLNPVAVHAGWMGAAPVAYGRPRAASGSGFDWYALDRERSLSSGLAGDKALVAADPGGLTVVAGDRLWRIDPSGRRRAVSGEQVRVARPPYRGTEGSRLANTLPAGSWVVSRTEAGQRLAWADAAGLHPLSALPENPPPGAVQEVLGGSVRAGRAVLRTVDAHGVERIAMRSAGGDDITASKINVALAETDPPRVVAIRHQAPSGAVLTSWMFLPAADRNRPPPLIVRPYLGAAYPSPPRDAAGPDGFFQNLRVLTGQGYAVLVPSLPNPPGGLTDPMDHVADRILSIVAAAAATPELEGRFDPGRMALLGWSFGGYTTMAAITQTDRFRAAVEMDGLSDLVAYWSSLGPLRLLSPEEGYGSNWRTGTVEQTQPELHAPPWADPQRYLRNSPLMFADRIHTPLLMIHGFMDPVPIAGSEAMYSALFRQGKDALFVTYWGELHAPTSPGDVRDIYARTFKFLDERLGP
jgi:dipeptidyl aminopeptidase/acylaminoacyl peptidase